jgi:thiamine kinase-like enzyme
MKEEKFIRAIQQGYGIEITHPEFLLRGFGGDCYRAETRPSISLRTGSGISYFLKLHDPVNNQMMAASSRDFYLPLMHQLHAKEILPHIPHPLPTLDGALSLRIGANELVITNFIAGELVGFGALPEPILAQLAELVGILHASKAQLEFEHPFIEQFDVVFEQSLLKSFDTLAALDASASPGQQLLRDIILPQQAPIVAHLEQLKELQAVVRSTYAKGVDNPMVVCHTDLHGGNLMTDGEGNLYILDWENAMIAPLEHDMIFFAGETGFFETFWPNYTRHFRSASLDLELLRFYFYRRGLEDVADFILRILRRANSPERDQQEIQWMRECLIGLGEIENTVSRLEKIFGIS